jgi:hypothetical protein
MTAVELDSIHIAAGIEVPNFFNGRVLSAEDLRLLLDADRHHRRLLGQAIGRGVASGLRVTRVDDRRVQVHPGVAVNGHGETVALPHAVSVDVSGSFTTGSSEVSTGIFYECTPSAAELPGVQNAFVLTVRPDATVGGSAPADPAVTASACGPGSVREGVRLRRRAFDPRALAESLGLEVPEVGSARARTLLAHAFLGTAAWHDFAGASLERPAAVDAAFDAVGLTTCEVALATFFVSGVDVIGLDVWGVRRPCTPRVHRPDIDDGWDLEQWTAPERSGRGRAAFLQFQAHLAELVETGYAPQAEEDFPYLPSAGLLPEAVLGDSADGTTFADQDAVPFFSGVPHHLLVQPLPRERVEQVIRRGTEMPGIRLPLVAGRQILLALVAAGSQDPPHAVFFDADHPEALWQRSAALTARVDDLEADQEAEPAGDPRVSAVFAPQKEMVRAAGSAMPLGDAPFLTVGSAGVLRFRVRARNVGLSTVSVTTSDPEGQHAPTVEAMLQLDKRTRARSTTTQLGESWVEQIVHIVAQPAQGFGRRVPRNSGRAGQPDLAPKLRYELEQAGVLGDVEAGRSPLHRVTVTLKVVAAAGDEGAEGPDVEDRADVDVHVLG